MTEFDSLWSEEFETDDLQDFNAWASERDMAGYNSYLHDMSEYIKMESMVDI